MCKCIQKSLWFIIIRVGFGRYEIVVCFTHVGVMPYARYASKTLTVFWTLNESEREIYNFFYYYLLYSAPYTTYSEHCVMYLPLAQAAPPVIPIETICDFRNGHLCGRLGAKRREMFFIQFHCAYSRHVRLVMVRSAHCAVLMAV